MSENQFVEHYNKEGTQNRL